MLKHRTLAAAMLAATFAVAPAASSAQSAAERSWALMLFSYGKGGTSPAHLMSRTACATAAKVHKELLSFGGRTQTVVTCTNIITGEVDEH